MRILLFSLVILSSFSLQARKRMDYYIKSDTLNKKVADGFVHVYGKVTNYNDKPIANALISTIDNKTSTKTNKKGEFSFLIHDYDTSIYLFKTNHNEVVIYRYNFKNKHDVEIVFYTYYREEIQVAEKPVIYLYSDKEIKANIELKAKGELIFTYPKYKDAWEVTVSQNGIKHNNKTYPYLFWESKNKQLDFDFNLPVSIVKTDTIIAFLENKLAAMGLNSTEKTDFITYWAPRIEKEPYAVIQFQLDDDYEKNVAQLNVQPQPKNSRRVFMIFYGAKSDYKKSLLNNTKQTFKPLKREGFTLIEWGGAELKTLNKTFTGNNL